MFISPNVVRSAARLRRSVSTAALAVSLCLSSWLLIACDWIQHPTAAQEVDGWDGDSGGAAGAAGSAHHGCPAWFATDTASAGQTGGGSAAFGSDASAGGAASVEQLLPAYYDFMQALKA